MSILLPVLVETCFLDIMLDKLSPLCYTISKMYQPKVNGRILGPEWYDTNGKLRSGHPALPGGGRPAHKASISEALRMRLDEQTCQELADMMIEMSLQGNTRILELVLDRSEGKVIQQLTIDTEITIIHDIPRPIEAVYEQLTDGEVGVVEGNEY